MYSSASLVGAHANQPSRSPRRGLGHSPSSGCSRSRMVTLPAIARHVPAMRMVDGALSSGMTTWNWTGGDFSELWGVHLQDLYDEHEWLEPDEVGRCTWHPALNLGAGTTTTLSPAERCGRHRGVRAGVGQVQPRPIDNVRAEWNRWWSIDGSRRWVTTTLHIGTSETSRTHSLPCRKTTHGQPSSNAKQTCKKPAPPTTRRQATASARARRSTPIT